MGTKWLTIIWKAAQKWLRIGFSKMKISMTSETRLPKNEKSSHHSECLSTETGCKTCKYSKTDNIKTDRYRMKQNTIHENILHIKIKYAITMSIISRMNRETIQKQIRTLGIRTIMYRFQMIVQEVKKI